MDTLAITWLHKSVHTASPCVFLPHFCHPQWTPGAIILLLNRDRLCVYAAIIRVSSIRCRLERNVAHAGKNGSLCNAREKAWMMSWLHRSMWLLPGHCSICTTIVSQTRPGSIREWLLSQQTPIRLQRIG